MGFFMKLYYVLCILLVVCFKANAVVQLPPNVTIPAVLAFGDSIIDTGNNNWYLTLFKSNFPPYGRDFPGGVPTGRFSNGKVPSDIVVEELGIKDLLPAYRDPNLNPNELATGVCFASAGSGFDPLTSLSNSVISLSTQLDSFKEYIGKLRGIVGEDKTNFILANSVYLVVGSSNDIALTFFVSHHRGFDFPAYADFLVNKASDFFKELYGLGARRIAVFGAPPIGCLPFIRTVKGGLSRNCSSDCNDASILYNNKLLAEIQTLKQNLPNSKVGYVDIYSPLQDIINNGQQHGFKVVDRGCCGTGRLETAHLCNIFVGSCPNAQEYMFFDSFHASEALCRIVVRPALEKYIHDNLSNDNK